MWNCVIARAVRCNELLFWSFVFLPMDQMEVALIYKLMPPFWCINTLKDNNKYFDIANSVFMADFVR